LLALWIENLCYFPLTAIDCMHPQAKLGVKCVHTLPNKLSHATYQSNPPRLLSSAIPQRLGSNTKQFCLQMSNPLAQVAINAFVIEVLAKSVQSMFQQRLNLSEMI